MTADEVFARLGDPTAHEPNWRTPNEFYEEEARVFAASEKDGGLDLDEAVARRLLKFDLPGGFKAYRRWYRPDKRLVRSPEQTVSGMKDAGQALSEAIDEEQLIAVFCDYDVDGTTAGEVFRRGLAPYGAKFFYGWADAQRGFGLTDEFVREAHKRGASVLITLDCGSTQSPQVALAQRLGMQVFVVDHHNVDPDNPADHHLNPRLKANGSGNTGAQLAWKLAAAVQQAKEGRTREEHWQEPLQLAGMGALADMGSVIDYENRAFFWLAADHVPLGVRKLAEALGEEPLPGRMVTTQAALNLPKRTALVDAADVGGLLAAQDEAEADRLVKKLVSAYEEAKPVRREMTDAALAQTGEAVRHEDGSVDRPGEGYLAVAVLDDYADYAGYSGPVASQVSRAAGKPAVVFTHKGRDEHEQELYKFSARNDCGAKGQLGELIENQAMQEATKLIHLDESGAKVFSPVLGGHSAVVSGSCTKENIPRVVAAMEDWAGEVDRASRQGFWPAPWDGPDAFLSERRVSGERLERIEAEAVHLGPFAKQRSPLPGSTKASSNNELQLSVVGTLADLVPDPEREGWLAGQLDIEGGARREIRVPADIDGARDGERREWVLRVGSGGPYYLRVNHPLAPES